VNGIRNPLTLARYEDWALKIANEVAAGRPVEDARVELKREWISPEKAARRLAAHANAARGAEILWLIGVDEVDGVVGTADQELADWCAMVSKQFDGVAPSLTDLVIHRDGKQFHALVFRRNGRLLSSPIRRAARFHTRCRFARARRYGRRGEAIFSGCFFQRPSCPKSNSSTPR